MSKNYVIKKFISKFDLRNTIFIIILIGVFIRICYFLYTSFDIRGHDIVYISGHLEYINYIVNKFSLPDSGGGQFYHPPLHYILSAILFLFGKLIGLNNYLSGRLLQIVMVGFSSLSMVLVYKMLKSINMKKSFIIAGTAIFAFHPTNILLSVQINNDNLMLFFYVLTFYLLIKWLKNKSINNIVLIALSMSAAILTKKSAMMIAAPIGIAFIVELFRQNTIWKTRLDYLKQYIIFAIIAIPLSLSHILRNYLLFNQGLTFVQQGGGGPRILPNTLLEFISFPLNNFFNNLFVDPMKGAHYFEYSFKSSLFGEWNFDYINWICSILAVSAIVVMVLVFIQIVAQRKREFTDYGYIFLLNIIVPIALAISMRIQLPAGYSQDFRYLAPILISGAFFMGSLLTRLERSDNKLLSVGVRYFVIASISIFCISSAIFIISIG